jgi:glucose/galactose transporter
MALPSAKLLRQTGLKNGMMIGLMVMAAGALIFIPAALLRTYPLFLLGLFVMGTGLALLQTASNPYVAVLGPMESAAQRMSIMGICNKVAGVLSPLIISSILFQKMDSLEASIQLAEGASRAAELDTLAQKAILPYLVIMLVLLGLALFVKYSRLPNIDVEEDESKKANGSSSIFSFPHFWFGVLALFLYVGVEVIAIDTIALYGRSLGYSLEVSRTFPSYPLLAMILGYLLGIIAIPKYISQARALAICAALGIIFTVAAVNTPDKQLSIAFIALLGLANSLMWPAIFPLAIQGLGKFTKEGSAILIMAIAGGATIPLLYGHAADLIGNQPSYLMMAPCYAVILLFAVTRRRQ